MIKMTQQEFIRLCSNAILHIHPDMSRKEAEAIVCQTYAELFEHHQQSYDRFSMMGYTVLIDQSVERRDSGDLEEYDNIQFLMPKNAMIRYLSFIGMKNGASQEQSMETARKLVRDFDESSWNF